MATPIIMPKLGLTMETGILTSWLKAEGEKVYEGDPLCEIQTDKINNVVESPVSGVLLKIVAQVDEEIPVLKLLAVIGDPKEDISALLTGGDSKTSPEESVPEEPKSIDVPKGGETGRRELKASPRARGIMDEHGLTVADFSGFVGERIGEADVRRLLAERSSQAIKPLTSLQATAARRLTQSFRDVPQFSVRFRVNADHLSVIRPELASQTGQKLTWNDFFIRAIAAAVAMEPSVQRQFSEAGFLCPESVNVGFAVDTDAGLVVPVIKDAGRLSVSEISSIAADLTLKARSNALSFAEASGGTITVSNLGMFGIDSFVPIVNPPESMIVGIGGIRKVAEWVDGSFQARQIVELTLACDHRAVDGAMAARFCQRLTRILESGPEEGW